MRILFLLLFCLFSSCQKGTSDSLKEAFSSPGGNGTGASTALVNAVSSIIPQSGSTSVNTNLTVLGSGFSTGQLKIFIGSIECTGVTIVNDIQASCSVAPQVAGQYDVKVSLDGTELTNIINGFVYINDFAASFNITSLSPVNGGTTGGTTITINGSDFDGSVLFQIDGTNCQTTTIINSTTGTCVTPAKAIGYYDVSAKKGAETKTLSNVFQYTGPPTVSSVDLSNVPATIPTVVTITGTNFVSGADVEFQTNVGNYNCNSVNVSLGGSQITCSTPALSAGIAGSISGASTIQVKNPDTTSATLATSLTFDPPPIHNSISFTGGILAAPIDGVMKTTSTLGIADFSMSISGTNFSAGLSVTLGGLAAAGCTRINSTQIDCSVLPDQGTTITTSKNLVILNPDGQSYTEAIVLAGRPNITSISPGVDIPTGGSDIDFTGTNLTGANPTITLRNDANTIDLGNCTIVSPSIPRCTVPNIGTAQNIDFRYKNSYGYWEDFNGLFLLSDPAEMLITWPAIADGSGTNELGKFMKGSSATIVARIHNTSGAINITSMTVDDSAIGATNFSYDSGSSTCTGTILPGAYCDLYFSYNASTLEVIDATGNININFNNGVAAASKSFNFKRTWVVPPKFSWVTKDFGDIPNGNNHIGKSARFMHILKVYNPTNNALNINIAGSVFSNSVFTWAGGAFPGSHPSAKVQAEECPVTGIIPANTNCFLTIAFTPTAATTYSESLTLTYDGGNSKIFTLTGKSTSSTVTTCNPAGTANFGGGDGSPGNPYLLCSKQHWEDLSDFSIADTAPWTYRTKSYLQTADIDLDSPLGGEIEPVWLTEGTAYYNGGGYTLANYKWTTARDDVAPFYANGSYDNLQIVDVNIDSTNKYHIGGIVASGLMNIKNSYSTGDINNPGGIYVGGFTGYSNSATPGIVENSYFVGDINCKGYSGGILGSLYNGRVLNLSKNEIYGTITQTDSGNGGQYIGGVVAYGVGVTLVVSDTLVDMNINSASSYVGGIVSLTGSSSDLTITGTKFVGIIAAVSYVGGILSMGNSTANSVNINQCGFEGSITGSGTYIGGIVGSCYGTGNCSISKSYSSGTVQGNISVGGISGYAGAVENNFVIGKVITTHSVISDIAGISKLTDGDLKNNYISTLFSGDTTVYFSSINNPRQEIYNSCSGVCANNYFLSGIGSGTANAGTLSRTAAQMKVSLPGLTDNAAVWKYAPSGYPYPMLDWMDDEWMP